MISAVDLGYETEVLENLEFSEVYDALKDELLLWVCGSGPGGDRSTAIAFLALEYKGNVKYMEVQEELTTNQVMLEGIRRAVSCIRKPSSIYIITATNLGFCGAFQKKGVNEKRIREIYRLLLERHCTFTEVQYVHGAEMIRKHILSCDKENGKKACEQLEQKKTDSQNRYKQTIYRECLTLVEDVLRRCGVSETVIDQVLEIRP